MQKTIKIHKECILPILILEKWQNIMQNSCKKNIHFLKISINDCICDKKCGLKKNQEQKQKNLCNLLPVTFSPVKNPSIYHSSICLSSFSNGWWIWHIFPISVFFQRASVSFPSLSISSVQNTPVPADKIKQNKKK